MLLGLRRPAIVPHGSFTARGFEVAIARAAQAARGDVAEQTHAALEAAGARRRSPLASEPGATVPIP